MLKNNWWLLKRIWKYTPGFVVFMIIEGIVFGSYHAVSIFYTIKLFDALEYARSFAEIIRVIAAYSIFLLCFFLFHY